MAIQPLRPIQATEAGKGPPPTPAGRAAPAPFARIIDQLIGPVTATQTQANQAVLDLALGRTDSLHGVMLAVSRADLAFRQVLEIRNRLSEALQEVLRMQV